MKVKIGNLVLGDVFSWPQSGVVYVLLGKSQAQYGVPYHVMLELIRFNESGIAELMSLRAHVNEYITVPDPIDHQRRLVYD